MASDQASTQKVQLSSDIPFWRDERVLRVIAQVISSILVIGFIIFLVINFFEAAEQRGLSLSYDFLKEAAGFPISESLIPYDPSNSFLYAFWIFINSFGSPPLSGWFSLTNILYLLLSLASETSSSSPKTA